MDSNEASACSLTGTGSDASDIANAEYGAVNVELAPGVSREFLLYHRLCPVGLASDGVLQVAVEPASVIDGLGDLSIAYEAEVESIDRSADDVQLLIERLATGGRNARSRAADQVVGDPVTDVRELANQPPVVRYVNLLIREAHDSEASDIHLESTREGMQVRMRLDGVLVAALEPPAQLERAIISRLKLLADLDIADRRRPQDGRIRISLGTRELDLRVATVPTMFGESVVLRLMERAGMSVGLEELGLPPDALQQIRTITMKPHGMLLATGPTGSGKTTTLYAAIRLRDGSREKIITVEDPVEHAVPGLIQVPVHTQAGLRFSTVLRSILRQDPDVLLIGEMRDSETAEIAIQAALTGHLVLSTLHTNDAIGAIARLVDLGAAPYMIAGTLEAVLAQRLVRRICSSCRVSYMPEYVPPQLATVGSQGDSAAIEPAGFARGRGCNSCRGTGFRGRIGLFELLVLSSDFRDAMIENAPRAMLEQIASKHGMRPLQADGWDKVRAGLTTVEEVLRVTGA